MRRLAVLVPCAPWAAFWASCVVLATAVMACGGGNEKPPLTPDTVEPETGADAGATTPSPVAPSSSAAPATGTTPAK